MRMILCSTMAIVTVMSAFVFTKFGSNGLPAVAIFASYAAVGFVGGGAVVVSF